MTRFYGHTPRPHSTKPVRPAALAAEASDIDNTLGSPLCSPMYDEALARELPPTVGVYRDQLVNQLMNLEINLPPKTAQCSSGAVFICTTNTERTCLERWLVGSTLNQQQQMQKLVHKGMPVFVYNVDSTAVYGPFEPAGAPALNIDLTAWPTEQKGAWSRYPVQVRLQRSSLGPVSQRTLAELRLAWNLQYSRSEAAQMHPLSKRQVGL